MTCTQKNLFAAMLLIVPTAVSLPETPRVQSTISFNSNSSDMAALGHRLFFDKRLSINNMKSCAGCHAPQFAFTDGYRQSLGSEADVLQRNAPSLLNIASYKTFNWANPDIQSMDQQLLHPLFNSNPDEMGLTRNDSSVLKKIEGDAEYKIILESSSIHQLTWLTVIEALKTYVCDLNSRNSKYDQFKRNEVPLTVDEKAGMQLFFSDNLNCKACHSGADFNEPLNNNESNFQNTGLYNIGITHECANGDNGEANVTLDINDIGKFRIPSLRNVALTSPYFHDGSAATLEEVITIYSEGGRNITSGPFKGDGRNHPDKSEHLKGFSISEREEKQLIQFLNTLTDTSYLTNPFFHAPE